MKSKFKLRRDWPKPNPRRSQRGCPMHYVYMLQSEPEPDRYYVGCTSDLKQRFAAHNSGQSAHTRKHMPWKLTGYVAFSDPSKARKFEAYLKTGSGRAFAKRHF